MKRSLLHLSTAAVAMVAALLFLGTTSVKAANTAPAAADTPKSEMMISISEAVNRSGASSPYERMARVFPEEFEHRHWPFTYATERLAGGTTEHALELKVYYKGIDQSVPGELEFRAWVTLTANGRDYDFGVIRARYQIPMLRPMDEVLDDITRQEAKLIAEKVEAVLFPNAPKSK